MRELLEKILSNGAMVTICIDGVTIAYHEILTTTYIENEECFEVPTEGESSVLFYKFWNAVETEEGYDIPFANDSIIHIVIY